MDLNFNFGFSVKKFEIHKVRINWEKFTNFYRNEVVKTTSKIGK